MSDNRELTRAKVVEVDVSPDRTQAFIRLKKNAIDEDVAIDESLVFQAIRQAGVCEGIKPKVIDEVIRLRKWDEKMLVAEGTPPIAGDDAILIFRFSTKNSLKPKQSALGEVDSRNVSLVQNANKDETLVRKTLCTPGKDGIDVFGQTIPAKSGRNFDVGAGAGTYRDVDGSVLAANDGVIHFNSETKELQVQQHYIVEKCVDYSTGNVRVNSSVEVKGDVKSGFLIETPYDVEIWGVVEQASILCQGSLKVHSGITGNGQERIEVGGEIHSSYIHKQTVRAKGSLFIGSELRGCHIECGNEVYVERSNGIILGGHVSATNKIEAAFIGNQNHIPTIVEVGVCSEYRDEYLAKMKIISEISRQMQTLRQQVKFVVNKYPEIVQKARLAPLRKSWDRFKKKYDALKNEIERIQSVYYGASSPEVYVRQAVHPGVIIKIKNAEMAVKEMFTKVRFGLVDNQIERFHLE